MRFCLRDGVVLEKVCGENILIATFKARKYCPKVTQINDAAADLWRWFSRRLDIDSIIKKIVLNYDISENEARKSLLEFVSEMEKYGYMVKEEDHD